MKKYTMRIIMLGYVATGVYAYGFGEGKIATEAQILATLDKDFFDEFNYYLSIHIGYRFKYPYAAETEKRALLKKELKACFASQRSLIEQGAFADFTITAIPEASNISTLRWATYMDNPEHVRLLLEGGAKNVAKGQDGNDRIPSIFRKRNAEILKLLMCYGVTTVADIEKNQNIEQRNFTLEVFSKTKQEYELIKEEWQKLMKPFAQVEMPKTFEEYANIIGTYVVVRQLVKRMNTLGIRVVTRKVPGSELCEYVVTTESHMRAIEENEAEGNQEESVV